ncbi:hypothetical protein FQA39_LY18245 [Lamprigera yunnana]|nr:hypothetical protein FQA39_LY18245 [Lamprigera yunnana]
MPYYNSAEEARLLQYNNASIEVLVDVTCYALNGDADKYIEMGYSTYLNLEPVIGIEMVVLILVAADVEEWKTLMGLEPYFTNQFFHDSVEIQHILEQSFKDNLYVQNISRTGDISDDVKIYYNWEYTERLSSSMTRTMTTTARNREDFLKTITLYRDYQTCTFNQYCMENIFCLKPV